MPRKNKGVHIGYRKNRGWEVREYIGGRCHRHASGLSCRELAEGELAKIIAQKQRPEMPEQCLTLGEIIAYYIKEQRPSGSSLKSFERIIPFWANLKLKDIRKSKTYEYIDYRQNEYERWKVLYGHKNRAKLSTATVRRELEQLQAAICYAYHDNIISIEPYIWKPDKSNPRLRWITKNEAARLLNAAKSNDRVRDYLPLFILIALYTGARSGAILNLRWNQVDLENGYIDFSSSRDNKIKKAAHIPISPKLVAHLKRQKKRGTDIGYVLHINQNRILSVKKSFSSACKKAGLDGVTPHILRHTAASWRVQRGVSLHKVAKLLGHNSTQMIEQVYGHMHPDHLKEAIDL